MNKKFIVTYGLNILPDKRFTKIENISDPKSIPYERFTVPFVFVPTIAR